MDIYENNSICSIGYDLSFAKDFSYATKGVSDELNTSTVQYATRRYLKKNDPLLKRLVPMSYAMRLSSDKAGSKPKRLVCVSPAENMELPGNWVEMKLLVGAKGITVQRVTILQWYPKQRGKEMNSAPCISSWVPEDDVKGSA